MKLGIACFYAFNAGSTLINTLYLASCTTLITLVSNNGLVYMKGVQLEGHMLCSKICKSCYRRRFAGD